MKTAITVLGFMVLTCCGWVVAQDLPPNILADQYLLEAAKAMEEGDAPAALRAFGKIEALDTEPPLEFLYFYGKLLVENSTTLDGVLKGQSLLKQYVLIIDRTSEHYRSTLELLSMAGDRLERFEARRRNVEKQRAEAERKRRAEAKRRAEERRKQQAEAEMRQQQAERSLFDAIQLGRTRALKALLDTGVDIHAKGYNGRTPLHEAASHSSSTVQIDGTTVSIGKGLGVTKILLNAGADVDAKDNSGDTPLHMVSWGGPTAEIAKALLVAGADVRQMNNAGVTPLHSAASRAWTTQGVELIRVLITAGADVHAKDNSGDTPLHWAALPGHQHDPARDNIRIEVIKILLDAGANIHAQNEQGETPLHKAAGHASSEFIKVLLTAGADVTVKDNRDRTPLDKAVERGNNRVSSVLKTYITGR